MEPQSKVVIQQPTIGRVVIFTARNDERIEENGDRVTTIDTYPGMIVEVHAEGVVDLVTFGPFSVYHNNGVPYGASGQAGTWSYPLLTKDTIEVLP